MPRARKTGTGAPAQPVKAVTGQQYGKGVEQKQLQAAMPAPQGGTPATQIVANTAQQAALRPSVQQPISAQPQQQADLMALAARMRDRTGLLTRPTERPMEPVTAGLPSGAGPGPEILGTKFRNPLGETLRNLARVSGDPFFAELADRSGI